MATRIGALYVDLALNSKQFIDELDKSRTRSATFGVAVGTIFANVAASAARMAKDAALSIPRLVASQIELADQLGKTSERTGIAVESLSVLRHQASLANVDFDTLTSSVGRFNKNVFSAIEGNKPLAKTMADLGVNLAGVKDGTVSAEDALLAAVDTLAKTDNQFKKTNLGADAFGKSFQELIPLVNEGRQGFEAARKELEEFGGLITGETAKRADAFSDNIDRLKIAVGAMGAQIASAVLPTLVELSKTFVDLVKEGENVEGLGTKIGNSFNFAANTAAVAALGVTAFAEGLSYVAEQIQALRVATATGLNKILPESLEGDVDGLNKGLEERRRRTEELAGATNKLIALVNKLNDPNLGKGLQLPTKKGAGAGGGDDDPDADKKKKELESLIASFEKALRPADELEKTLRTLQAAGKDSTAILKVYGEQILDTATKQRELGGFITPYIAALEAQKVSTDGVKLAMQGEAIVGEGLTTTLAGIAGGTLALAIRADGLRESIAALNQEMAIGSPRPFLTDDQLEQMTALPDGLGKIKEAFGKAKEAGKELGIEVSTSLTNAAQRIGDVIVQGGSLADVFDQSAKRIQSAILSTIIEQALNPLLEKLREISSVSGGGILSKILGIGASAIVSGTSGLGSAASGTTALSSTGVSGSSSIGVPLFAKGGDIDTGMTGLVGEAGSPELFVPKKTSLGRNILGAVSSFYKASFAQPFGLNVASGIASKGFGGVSGHFLSNTPGLFGFLSSLFLKKGSSGTLEQLPKITPFLNSAFGGQGAKLPDFKTLLSPDKETSITAPPQLSSMPMLLGTRGPEIFKPPEPGTIVPLNTPEGMKIYQYFKSMGRTREHGGDVGYMTGERGREMFLPASLGAGGTGGGNTTNIYLTVNGDPDQSVIRKMQQALKEVYQASVRDSQRGMIEHKLRTV